VLYSRNVFAGAFAEQTAYDNFKFPPGQYRGADGTIYASGLFAPTFHAEGTCLEISTQYSNNLTHLAIYDTCINKYAGSMLINPTFAAEYMTTGALDPGGQQLPLYVVGIYRDANHQYNCSPYTCDYSVLYDFHYRRYSLLAITPERVYNQDGWDMFESHYSGDLSCVNHPMIESGVILVGGSPPNPTNDPIHLTNPADCFASPYNPNQHDPPYDYFYMWWNQSAPYYGYWKDYYR